MTKNLRFIAMLMLVAITLASLASCDFTQQTEWPEGEVTVQWVQGQKLLKTETLKIGDCLTEWTPELKGQDFKGWYSDPAHTAKVDFTAPVTEDIKIYGKFTASGSTEPDEPIIYDYFLLGSGVGDLKKSGWNHANSSTKLGMTDEGNGVYSITINMYAGDMFQIGTGGGWGDGQWGIGCFTDAETFGATETEKAYAVVKNTNGDVVFRGDGGGYNNPLDKGDIVLQDGHDGVYKFTFDPVNAKITWTLVEKLGAYVPPTKDDLAKTVYFIPNAEWKEDGSVIGAWCWQDGKGGTWTAISDIDGDGRYEFSVPEGCDRILFVDLNVGETELAGDWSNKRAQTADLEIPTKDTPCYDLTSEEWIK